MNSLMHSAVRLAVQEAARILLRPDIAQLIENEPAFSDDHNFAGAPKTKAWIESHGQPAFSPHAEFINELIAWACELERRLKKEG